MGVNGQLIEGSLIISKLLVQAIFATVDFSSSRPTVFAFYAISELHDHMVEKGGVELVLR